MVAPIIDTTIPDLVGSGFPFHYSLLPWRYERFSFNLFADHSQPSRWDSPAYAMIVSSTSVNLTPGKGANLMVTLICESLRGSRSAILCRQQGLGAKQLKVGPKIERLGFKRIIRGWKGLSSY